MKKIIYTLLIVSMSSLVLSSCSEEEIKPNTEQATGGVTGEDKGF